MFHPVRSPIEAMETSKRLRKQRPDYLKIRLRRMVKSVLKQESANSSACPFAKTLTSSKESIFIKCAWLATLGLCIVMFIFQSYDRITYYFTYPVAVDVFITEAPFQKFPDVTLCYPEPNGLLDLMDKHNVSCHLSLLETLMRNTNGLSIEAIWRASNVSTNIASAKEINGDNILPLSYTEQSLIYGECTTLRSSNSNQTRQKGDHYFKITYKRTPHRCAGTYTKAYIHDPGDLPTLRPAYVFPTSMNGEMILEKQEYLFVNRTNNPCISNSDLRLCLENCFEKFIIKKGADKCRFPFYPSTSTGIPYYCTSSQETVKFWVAFRNYMIGATDNLCPCPRKCEHNTFDERPFRYGNATTTSTFIVRYGSPYETLVKERLCYGSIALFCDIGGNSGLYIGVSILSLFQLGHKVIQSRKKPTQFSVRDPLFKKVLKTFATLRKHRYETRITPITIEGGKVAKALKMIILSMCICLLITCIVNRVSYFFQHPTQSIVYITFNMSFETPTPIVCSGDAKILKLQEELAKSRNISIPCDINLLELFELPKVNSTYIWRRNENETMRDLAGTLIRPIIPIYDGSCTNLDDGRFTKPANSMNMFFTTSAPLCGTSHQKAYVRPSTGNIDYYNYLDIAHQRGQQILFIFKEIHIDQLDIPCISREENERCVTSCLNRKLFSLINCRLPYMNEAKLPICETFSSVRQAHNVFRDLFFVPGNSEECNCFRKCRNRFLEMRHFIEERTFRQTWFVFGAAHNVVESYITIYSYPIVKLLCDLGGLLGSTLGLCILGTVESILSILQSILDRKKSPNAKTYF